MDYGMSVALRRPFDEVIADVRAALAEQGFGVVSEIDMQATLKAKIGADIPPTVILGACNPGFAHQALQIEPSIGLLLPCNVVVRAMGDQTIVEMVNPDTMVDFTGNPAMRDISDAVTARLSAALTSL